MKKSSALYVIGAAVLGVWCGCTQETTPSTEQNTKPEPSALRAETPTQPTLRKEVHILNQLLLEVDRQNEMGSTNRLPMLYGAITKSYENARQLPKLNEAETKIVKKAKAISEKSER